MKYQNKKSEVVFEKWTIPVFPYFRLLNSYHCLKVQYKILSMTGFEPWTSVIRRDHSANWVTTTAQKLRFNFIQLFGLKRANLGLFFISDRSFHSIIQLLLLINDKNYAGIRTHKCPPKTAVQVLPPYFIQLFSVIIIFLMTLSRRSLIFWLSRST